MHNNFSAGVLIFACILPGYFLGMVFNLSGHTHNWNWNPPHDSVLLTCGPFYQRVSILITEWICNYIHYKVYNENTSFWVLERMAGGSRSGLAITYPFQNFNGVTVEVWEWISNSQATPWTPNHPLAPQSWCGPHFVVSWLAVGRFILF